MNFDNFEGVDEGSLVQRVIQQLRIIQKNQVRAIKQIAKTFNIDLNSDQLTIMRKLKQKIGELILNERNGYIQYLSLPKFKNLSQQSHKILTDICNKVWNKFDQQLKSVSEKKYQRQASSLIPELRNNQQYENYHLNILSLYRESPLCPKNFMNFQFSNDYRMMHGFFPSHGPNGMMGFPFQQRDSGQRKFEPMRGLTHHPSSLNMRMENNMPGMGGLSGMGSLNNMAGIRGMGNNINSINNMNNSMNSWYNSLNGEKQSSQPRQVKQFPPNGQFRGPEFMMNSNIMKRDNQSQRINYMNEMNPQLRSILSKSQQNKMKSFPFPNDGMQMPWVQYSHDKQFVSSKNQNSINQGSSSLNSQINNLNFQNIKEPKPYPIEKQIKQAVKTDKSNYFKSMEFFNCVCQGQQKVSNKDDFFKCNICSFKYHYECLFIKERAKDGISIKCPKCILKEGTLLNEVVQCFQSSWFSPKNNNLSWQCTIKRKDYKKILAQKYPNSLQIHVKFLKISGKSLIDNTNFYGIESSDKKITTLKIQQNLLSNFNEDIPLQGSVKRSQQENGIPELYLFGTFLIKKQKYEALVEKFLNNSNYHVGKEFIETFFKQNPDVGVNMIDPIIHQPIQIATRGNLCLHSHIFDLKAFLQCVTTSKQEKDKCPLCGKLCQHLLVDIYLTDYIKGMDKNRVPMTITVFENGQIREDPRIYNESGDDNEWQQNQNSDSQSNEDEQQQQNEKGKKMRKVD